MKFLTIVGCVGNKSLEVKKAIKFLWTIKENPNNDNLYNLTYSDIYWDSVKSIEKIGVRTVYDATVPGNANFVANDIIVHNSIEQDADVVMFLWRENEDNLENINLDIAKHRNGPLRSVKLSFRGDRMKFFGRETKRAE